MDLMDSRQKTAYGMLAVALTLVLAFFGYAVWLSQNYAYGHVVSHGVEGHVLTFDMRAGEGIEGMLFAVFPLAFDDGDAKGQDYKQEDEVYYATYDPEAYPDLADGDLVKVRLSASEGHSLVAVVRSVGR